MIFKFSSRITRQYMAGVSCCLSSAILSTAISWPAPAIPKLQGERPDVNLTNNEITWMVSSLYLGNLVSPIPSGYFMDRFGRKKTLLYATIFTIISWTILYFAIHPYQFYVARFLCGLSNGVFYMITPIYISEISESSVRGSIGNIITILVCFSSVYIYSIGMYVDYGTLVIATSLIPLAFLLTFTWIPETPYYYLLRNQTDKAVKSLTWFRCDKNKNDIIFELEVMELYMKEQMTLKSGYKELISGKANRKGLITILFLCAIQRFTGIDALMAYSSVILPKNSSPYLSLNQCVTILSILWFITTLLTSTFVDRFNRRTLLIVSSFGCGLTNLVATIWFYLDEKTEDDWFTETYPWIPFVSFLWHAEFYAVGLGPLGTSMRGELFASNIKGKGSAISSIAIAVASFVVGKFFLVITDEFGMYMNFLIFSVACFLSIIVVYYYVIETKGKTLEEIQDALNGIKQTIT